MIILNKLKKECYMKNKSKRRLKMKNPYPHEKFSKAIYSMATSSATIQERIHNAYIDQIIYVKVEDMPESVRFQFSSLLDELKDASTLSDEKASEKACMILYIANAIESDYFGR